MFNHKEPSTTKFTNLLPHCDYVTSVISLLYAFFWVIPRCLNFICQCFGTLCLFHLLRRVGTCQCSEMLAYKIQTPGNYTEETIQHLEHGKSLKSCYIFVLYIIWHLIWWLSLLTMPLPIKLTITITAAAADSAAAAATTTTTSTTTTITTTHAQIFQKYSSCFKILSDRRVMWNQVHKEHSEICWYLAPLYKM